MGDEGQHIVAPDVERAVLERAAACPATGIIEQQAGPSPRMGVGKDRLRLAAFHVRHIAGQEHQQRPRAGREPVGKAYAIGAN
jgi:hypothetical protein